MDECCDCGHQPDLRERLESYLSATKTFPRRAIRALPSSARALVSYLRTIPSTLFPPPPVTNFPLLALPTELRLIVYEHILSDLHVGGYEETHRRLAPDFAFLRTNSLVYREARMLYYDTHVFEFESVDEMRRLSVPQLQRIKHVKLHFTFTLWDLEFRHWRGVCAAVAGGMMGLRSLEIDWDVFWDREVYPTRTGELRAAWARGMGALRGLRGLRRVEGRVSTSVREVEGWRVGGDGGYFVVEWVGLEGLEAAFWREQAVRVRRAYGE